MPTTFTVDSVSSEWVIVDERGKTTGSTFYRIRASEPTTPAAARSASGVPVVGSDYPGTTGGVLPMVKRTCKPADQTRMLFSLEADYDSSFDALPESPLSAPTKVVVTDESYEESFYEDKASTPRRACHYNGVPFSELPKRDASIEVLEVEKNVESDKTMNDFRSLRNRVNSAAITVDNTNYAPGTLHVAGISLSEVKTESGVQYRTLKTKLKAREEGWDQKFESRGLIDADGLPKPLDGGKANEDPWPLDDAGMFTAGRGEAGAEITLKPYAGAVLTPLV